MGLPPPKDPSHLYGDGSSSSSQQMEVKENEEVELKCTVADARPKADIKWYRGNDQFNPGENN